MYIFFLLTYCKIGFGSVGNILIRTLPLFDSKEPQYLVPNTADRGTGVQKVPTITDEGGMPRVL